MLLTISTTHGPETDLGFLLHENPARAQRELALGIEGLERFVRREPLRRVHECVFGVLALESEPVDPRLQIVASANVHPSPMKRSALLLLLTCSLPACAPDQPPTPAPVGIDTTALAPAIDSIADRVRPGTLGVAVKDLATGQTWHHNGEHRFPMQSVFKAPLGAAVLAAVDRGELALTDTVVLVPEMLAPPYSPIAARFPERSTYTVEELLVAAVGGSDNTAADVLMESIGGPDAVTRWLRSKGVEAVSIDRYEREFQTELAGMPPFRPAWAKEDAFLRAFNAVPAATRREATAQYLADPRDTSTPLGAIEFLEALAEGRLLSPESTERLLRIMTETGTGARRIRAALPEGAALAHKTGSARPDLGMNPVVNDIGIITLPDGRRVILAVFLSATMMPYQEAETIHADVARAVLSSLLDPAAPAGAGR